MSLIECLSPASLRDTSDPVYGIVTRSEFKRLAKLPAGGFAREIRKRDPLWGRMVGDLKTFKVNAVASVTIQQTDTATFTVSACNKEQALELAGIMADDHHWNNLDDNPDDIDLQVVD